MNISKRRNLLFALILLLLAPTSLMAAPDWPNSKAAPIAKKIVKALPEIDASAGTSGIALLVGLLFLVKERPGRKRP
jgi:hypothetical protein